MKIDSRVSIGLRAPHIDTLLHADTALQWVEVHAENWMADSGPIAERLAQISDRFDLSLHGVGMSLGSADGIDRVHLRRLQRLVERCQPVLVSEHLSWGAIGGIHSNDLLPLPYNLPSARVIAQNIDCVQQALGRPILVENVSAYCAFDSSMLPEWEFVNEVVSRARCGLLLDLNNVHVNASNHGFDAAEYLAAMPWQRIGEIHLAGYEQQDDLIVDTHSRAVQAPVWRLFEHCRHRLADSTRVLVEWDNDLPALEVLLAEAVTASAMLAGERADHA